MATEIVANNKRIVKNTILLYIRMFIVLLISLYTTRVLLRVLGVEDYGIYNVVSGFVAMFSFLNGAMANGIQRFYNVALGKEGEEGLTPVYNASIRIQVILAIIIFVLIEGIGIWYINNIMVLPAERLPAANIIFQLSALSLLIVIIQAPYTGAIMAMERMDFYSIVSIVETLIRLGCIFILQTITYDKLATWGVLSLAITLIVFFLSFAYCKKQFKFLRFKRGRDSSLFKSMLSFSGWNLFGTMSGILKDQGVNMILNYFCGPVVNAARGISHQISAALQGFISNNNIAVRPQLTQSYAQGDTKRTFNLMFSISKLNYYLLLIMAVPLGVEINFVLKIWLGDTIPDYTAPFTLWIMATGLINNLNSPISLVVHATGRMKLYQLSTGFFSLLLVAVSIVLLKIGLLPESVFVATFVITVINQVASLYILRSLVPFSLKEYVKDVVLPCLLVTMLAIGPTLLLKMFMEDTWLCFIIVVLFGVIISMLSSYLVGMNRSERKMALQFVNKFIRRG